MEYIKLYNGKQMPMIGYGVYQDKHDPNGCEEAVLNALKTGYRLIDTAAAYMNEEAVGSAIKKSGIKREELFVTSKIWVQDFSYESAKKAIDKSLENLGLDYLDLYLIHQPVGDYIGAYRALEEAYDKGKLKAIGVSNFYPARLVDLCLSVRIKPMVNQVELHPFFQQHEALKIMKEEGIVTEAWGPFAEGKFGIFQNPTLVRIGEKYHKSAAQVALRWNMDRGVVVIPKSTHIDRIKENFDVFDFHLTPDEMQDIAKLDLGHSEIVDYDLPMLMRMFHEYKIHN